MQSSTLEQLARGLPTPSRAKNKSMLPIQSGSQAQGAIHAAGASRLRSLSRQGAMQCLSPRRWAGEDPLFTDFTASNIGTPPNPRLPYYAEQQPDARGYVANPAAR